MNILNQKDEGMKKAMKLFAVIYGIIRILGCAKEETATFELKDEMQTSTLTCTTEAAHEGRPRLFG